VSRKVSIILPYYNRKKLLIRTLDSFQLLYSSDSGLEIVIVDDHSDDKNRIEDLVRRYNLNIMLFRLPNKSGVNPCYPYNVGVRQSKGSIIVLSSPEILHTSNMFEISNNFEKLDDVTYFQFSVFCLLEEMEELDTTKFYENLGETGFSYANRFGSWYTHSKIRPTCLNFFSALTRNTYYRLSGFDERFRYGTGYDDEEFKLRILELVDSVEWMDNAEAVHMNHEIVGNLPPTTNWKTFRETRQNVYKSNDDWGRL
jgi:glycosyltransferase involved in cell wall biosynthesis